MEAEQGADMLLLEMLDSYLHYLLSRSIIFKIFLAAKATRSSVS